MDLDHFPVGEYPPLPGALILELHRRFRAYLADRVWQSMANGAVTVFEGYKRN